MATYRRCRACGDYHWTDAWPDNHVEPEPERSPLSAPQVMRDTPEYMSPLGTGLITSRSQRREDLKRGGCVEVGPSDWKPQQPIKPRAKWAKQHGLTAAS